MRRGDQWQKRIPRDCLATDRRKCRQFIREKMVDTAWCERQIDLQQNMCYHCGTFMNWINRQTTNGLTCERLDTSLPHHKSNCVLCCFRCNNRKLSKERSLLLRYFRNHVTFIFALSLQECKIFNG